MNNFEENRRNHEVNENYFLQSKDRLEKNQQEYNEHILGLINEDAAKGLLDADDLELTPEEQEERRKQNEAYEEVMGNWRKKNSSNPAQCP